MGKNQNQLPGFREIISDIAKGKGSTVSVFGDFCRAVACALAVGSREREYFEVLERYQKSEMEYFSCAMANLIAEMEKKSFEDVLGPYYLEVSSKSTQSARGEFYTPPNISKMMARMLFDAESLIQKGTPISIGEPACGAGGMVLAIAELMAPHYVDLLRVTCCDINPIAADMCFINTTLWGIPARIVWGDSIRDEVHGSWKNIHWFRVGGLAGCSSTESEHPDIILDSAKVHNGQMLLF